MKGKRIFLALALVMAMICLSGMAMANSSYVLTGEGDWNQAWTENGLYGGSVQTFDKMEVFVVTGNPWLTTALTGLSGGWHFDGLVNPKYGVASGADYTPGPNFNYTTNGVDPLTNPFVWDMYLSLDGNIVGGQRSTWNGAWSYSELHVSDYANENKSPVPLPPSILLLGSGILGLVGFRRRRQT